MCHSSYRKINLLLIYVLITLRKDWVSNGHLDQVPNASVFAFFGYSLSRDFNVGNRFEPSRYGDLLFCL